MSSQSEHTIIREAVRNSRPSLLFMARTQRAKEEVSSCVRSVMFDESSSVEAWPMTHSFNLSSIRLSDTNISIIFSIITPLRSFDAQLNSAAPSSTPQNDNIHKPHSKQPLTNIQMKLLSYFLLIQTDYSNFTNPPITVYSAVFLFK